MAHWARIGFVFALLTCCWQASCWTRFRERGRTLKDTELTPDESFRAEWENILMKAQDYICDALSQLDGKTFQEEIHERKHAGWGRGRVMEEGNVFEKAGISITMVHGTVAADFVNSVSETYNQTLPPRDTYRFYSAGLELMVHPKKSVDSNCSPGLQVCSTF
eukprot:Selendium_serpulae@DN6261_c2_g1_i1.p1